MLKMCQHIRNGGIIFLSIENPMSTKKTSDKKDEKKEKEIKTSTIIYAAVFAILVFLVFIAAAIYGFGMDNKLIQKTAAIIPYPAAILGTDMITLNKLNDRTASVKRFYENQDFSDLGMRVDFNTDDGKKRLKIKEKYVLNKMIEDLIVENESKKRGIVLTDEIISQEVDRKIKEYGSESYLRENMARLYGWSVEDFKKNIVRPDMYQEKLLEYIKKNDPDFQKATDEISKAKNDLDSKQSFSEVAKRYSQGDSAKNGGLLGWFNVTQMLPEIAEVAFSLEKGKSSDIIESSIGYHIVKVEDKKNEDGVDFLKISQIFVRTETLGEWLGKQEKGMHIYIPLKDFYWDSEKLDVEFSSQDLKNFEENLQKNSPDDISVMF